MRFNFFAALLLCMVATSQAMAQFQSLGSCDNVHQKYKSFQKWSSALEGFRAGGVKANPFTPMRLEFLRDMLPTAKGEVTYFRRAFGWKDWDSQVAFVDRLITLRSQDEALLYNTLVNLHKITQEGFERYEAKQCLISLGVIKASTVPTEVEAPATTAI